LTHVPIIQHISNANKFKSQTTKGLGLKVLLFLNNIRENNIVMMLMFTIPMMYLYIGCYWSFKLSWLYNGASVRHVHSY
jgi:hypothetical protein